MSFFMFLESSHRRRREGEVIQDLEVVLLLIELRITCMLERSTHTYVDQNHGSPLLEIETFDIERLPRYMCRTYLKRRMEKEG